MLPDVWRRRPLYYYSGTARPFGHGDPIPAPASERLDYELELAAVIGTETGDAPEADAMDAIVGFTLFNDWSARDIQADEMAYGLGPSKGKDFGSSFGPWLVTTDELRPQFVDGRLDLVCAVRVNGETWVESGSREMSTPGRRWSPMPPTTAGCSPGICSGAAPWPAAPSARRCGRADPASGTGTR